MKQKASRKITDKMRLKHLLGFKLSPCEFCKSIDYCGSTNKRNCYMFTPTTGTDDECVIVENKHGVFHEVTIAHYFQMRDANSLTLVVNKPTKEK